MKIRRFRRAKQLASSFIIVLFLCTLLSLFVMYYMSLVNQQSYLTSRSQSWNLALVISEAGVEEGLQQLNSNYPTLATDGWTYDGTLCYWRSNTLPDGNSYTSYIYLTNSSNPVVVARAWVIPPPVYSAVFPETYFAAAGVTVSPTTVSRAVQVTTKKSNLFLAAMVAKHTIDLNGNNINTDSFDSSNPAKSTNGQYDPSKYAGDMGDVASNDTIANSLSVGNANIHGHTHTGIGSAGGSVAIGPNGVIGTHAWAASNNGIQPTYWAPDANFTFPDTSMPNTGGYLIPAGGTITTVSNYVDKKGVSQSVTLSTTYDHILPGNNDGTTSHYVLNSSLGNTLVQGTNVVLAMPNGLSMGGGDSLTIAQAAGLTIYAGGTSIGLAGNSVFNQPGYASSMILYCAPSVTSFSLSGNAGFTGVLVAPNANVSMNGGGNNTTDFIGSLMVNSVTMNGHFNFHFDEALLNCAANGRFLIMSWNEVK